MTVLGWALVALPVALVAYAYLIYPAILRAVALVRPSAGTRGASTTLTEPPLISIVVPAYNEEAQIRQTLDALLAQDYPRARTQILVVSDASIDRTDEIVREYGHAGVELLRVPYRGGKTSAENAACALIRGEIVINSDASARLHPAAVRRLVASMADPNVGVASTRDVSVSEQAADANLAESGYVGYEMAIRALETRTGGIIGASGSGYAIRAHLHRLPVRHDLSRDFLAAITAHRHGFTAVSVPDAVCIVPRTASLRTEYRRKVRTIARGIDTLLSQRHALDPMRHGLFAWKLISHKVCRWLAAPAMLFGAIGLALLSPTYPWAGLGLEIGVGISIACPLAALFAPVRLLPRVVSLIAFGVAAQVAVLHALMRVARRHDDHLWEPTRRGSFVASSS
jgi:cellulose synthase/poly-beta-1,6-N-acetylglucosamine synthase-like glycosyltransferase